MRPLPIRVRLAVWYCAVLTATFLAFSLFAYIEVRNSLSGGLDDELRDRLQGFQKLLRKETPAATARDIARVLAEHTGGNDLFRMTDQVGAWVYRSPAVDALEAQLPPIGDIGQPASIATVHAPGFVLRILTATLLLPGGDYRVQVGASIGVYESTTSHFARVMLTAMPVLLVVSVSGGLWLSRRALLPVDRITREAQQITARSLGQRLEVPQTRDELQQLSETLNAMLERLDQSFQRITQFTADASHELKTPLAVMRTTAEVPLRIPSSETEYREALTGIVAELGRTSKLVDDLLSVARGDSGTIVMRRVRSDLVCVVKAAAAQGELMARARELIFRREVGDAPIWVDGDCDALHRLLLILLDNATKYTPPPGVVTLKAFAQGGFACVEVADTGIGIDETELPRVFERFYRADKARSRDSYGTGLGLAIARWIAIGHGGTIEVASVRGEGSAFSIRLPAVP